MSVAPAPDREREIVVGVVDSITVKGGGSYQIEVKAEREDGTVSQYTKGLWTKDTEIVNMMAASIGVRLAFDCGASHWTMSDGTPVRSLWINGYSIPSDGVVPGVVGAAPAAPAVPGSTVGVPAPAPQPVPGAAPPTQAAPPPVPVVPVTPVVQSAPQAPPQSQRESTEDKIHRQTATKVAVQLLPYLTEEARTFTNLITISERLVAYYEKGVAWAGVNPTVPQGDGSAMAEAAELSPHDDGIPF